MDPVHVLKPFLKTMDEETQDDLESLNQEGEQDTTPDGEETEQDTQELKKAKELADNYKIRAEKAEAKLKEKGGEETPKNEPKAEAKGDLSQKDLIVLIKADVTEEEDIQEVVDFAKLKNISVAEALKSSVIRTVLSEKKEERQTAEVTATGNKRGGTTAASGKDLLRKAESKGELPDTDEGIDKLLEARFAQKQGK
jgi:hypothetical protein